MLPITAVQLLGVYIRYEAYGLTTLRYLSMLCTAFGLASLFQGMRRKSIQGLWLLSAALILLVTVTPANAIDIPVQNQQDRLYAALDSAHMVKDGDIVEGVADEKERQQIRSAWQYIRQSPAVYADREAKKLAESPILARMAEESEPDREWEIHADSMTLPAKGASSVTWFEEPVAADCTMVVNGPKGKQVIQISPFMKQVVQAQRTGHKPVLEYVPQKGCRLLFLHITFEGDRAVHAEGMMAE